MRVGSLEIARRRDLAAAPEGPIDEPSTGSLGTDAASMYNLVGLRQNENPEMQGKLRFALFDEMRWSDPTVKSSLWLYKLPMRAGDYKIAPATEDPLDRVVADGLAYNFGLPGPDGRSQLGLLDLSWSGQLAQKFLKLDYGAMFEEIVWGDIVEWADADGDTHLVRPIVRCAPRFPATIRLPWGIYSDAATGNITWLIQDLPGARPIPGEKLAWYALDREGTDWFGTSLLRPMYGAWRLKRALMVSVGMGWDRYALGVPAVWYPRGGGAARKMEAEAIGRNFRAHERSWLVFEGKRGDPTGWDIDIIHGGASMPDATPLLRLYDEQIATAAMQHFMVLGRTATGNRALGEALGEPYYLAAQSIADDTADEIVRHVFRKWIDANFGSEFASPRITVSNIQTHNILELSQAIMNLSDAGLAFGDPDTQNDIRDVLNLRHLPEAVANAVENGDVGIEAVTPQAAIAASGGVTDQSAAGPPQPGVRQLPPGAMPNRTDFRPESIAKLAEGDDLPETP